MDCQDLVELNSVFDQYRTCIKCDEIYTKQGRTQSTDTGPHTASHDQSGYMQSVIPGASGPFSETSAAAGRTFPPCLTKVPLVQYSSSRLTATQVQAGRDLRSDLYHGGL